VLLRLWDGCPRKIGTGPSNHSRQSAHTFTTSVYLNFSNPSRNKLNGVNSRWAYTRS